jgi:glycosyltransferase involved in cell wall biosynthesis
VKYLFAHEVNYRTKVIFEMHEFPELLAKMGHDIHFLEFPERLKKSDSHAIPGWYLISGRVYQSVLVNLITPFTFSYGIIQRLSFFVTSFVQIPIILRRLRPDVIVTYAVPTFGLQLLIAGRILKIPVVYRAIDVSHQIRKSIFNPAIKVVEGLAIRFASLVSCNNRAMQSYVIKRGAFPENTEVIYAPIDVTHFRNSDSRHSGDVKEIIFLGTLFEFSGLEEFIRDAHTAGLFTDGYRLSIIGGGDRFEALKHLISKLSLENVVTMHGFVPYQDLGPLLRNPGIAINPFQKNNLTDSALPHKVIQYAAARKLIVSNSLEGLQGLFDCQDTVYWVTNSQEMVNSIRRIATEAESDLDFRLNRQDKVFETKLNNQKNLALLDSSLKRMIFNQK